MFGLVRSSFQLLTVSLGSITECVFWGCSDSSLDRNLAPNVSCGLGTECYRDISIDCCADTWLLMSFVSVGKVRFMSYVTSRARVQHNSQPMRWQERGDVGGSISAQVEELRMDASSKGRTWLQEKMASMTRDDLRKVAAASDVLTRRQDGSKVALAELRNALVEHFAPQASLLGGDVWFGEEFVSVVNSFFG